MSTIHFEVVERQFCLRWGTRGRRLAGQAMAAIVLVPVLATAGLLQCAGQTPTSTPTTFAVSTSEEWQQQVRRDVTDHQLDAALAVVEYRLATHPEDLEAHGWRGRLLSWQGHWSEGEAEYWLVLGKVPDDTEILVALSDVLLWQKRYKDCLQILDRARGISPSNPEILVRRARVLAILGRAAEARRQYQELLSVDPHSIDGKTDLRTLSFNSRHEFRAGNDTDFFSYTNAAQTQSVSLSSRWNPRWSTVFGTNVYQRFGEDTVKFSASAALHLTGRDWLSVGSAVANQQQVVPTTEAFFEYGHGFHFESRLVPGLESSYQQHWYWYEGAHVLALSASTLVYFPKLWTLSLTVTAARTGFAGSAADWLPSGWTKLGFPLHRRLTGNLFYAVGSENFSQVDQIGRFGAHTYGGGLRHQLAEKQDVTGYVSRQYRTQGQTETSFGLSYGIRF